MRLTKYNHTTSCYKLAENIVTDECLKKLGQLEDIEGKAGVELTVLYAALASPTNYYEATIDGIDYMLITENFVDTDGKLRTTQVLYKDSGNCTWNLVCSDPKHDYTNAYNQDQVVKNIKILLQIGE